MQAMRGQQVKGTTIVPEAKIREYYQQHVADYTSAEELKLRMQDFRTESSVPSDRRWASRRPRS